MACKYCGKKVVLVPSATERAKKYGKTAAYYRALFPNHSACELSNRDRMTRELIQRLNNEA